MEDKKTTDQTAAGTEKKNVLELKNPIKINGDIVKKLAYDFDSLNGNDMNMIDKYVAGAKQGVVNTSPHIAGYDATENRYTFMQAVLKVNKGYDIMDLERLSYRDLTAGERLARFFIYGREDGTDET